METPFENIQIDINSLPRQDDVQFTHLQGSYLLVSMISLGIFWTLAFLLAYLGPEIFDISFLDEFAQFIYFGLLIAALLSFLLAYLGFKKKGYALREKDIMYKSGLIWKAITTIPFSRIQHCEVKEGPIERLFGLSSLHIYTAGGSSSDIDIPGLYPQQAQDIKSFVLKKINTEDEEE